MSTTLKQGLHKSMKTTRDISNADMNAHPRFWKAVLADVFSVPADSVVCSDIMANNLRSIVEFPVQRNGSFKKAVGCDLFLSTVWTLCAVGVSAKFVVVEFWKGEYANSERTQEAYNELTKR